MLAWRSEHQIIQRTPPAIQAGKPLFGTSMLPSVQETVLRLHRK
jgi:hypothetical protein